MSAGVSNTFSFSSIADLVTSKGAQRMGTGRTVLLRCVLSPRVTLRDMSGRTNEGFYGICDLRPLTSFGELRQSLSTCPTL